MRDLTTLATVTGEAKRRLRDVRTALVNRREGLAREEAEEKAILAELDSLEAEFSEALASVRAIGLEGLTPQPGIYSELATSVFEINPQDVGPATLNIDENGARVLNRAENGFEQF